MCDICVHPSPLLSQPSYITPQGGDVVKALSRPGARPRSLSNLHDDMIFTRTTYSSNIVQAVMFAENRLAPCMGSTVCEEYAGNDGADAAATWVVLKACVAEWELRLRLSLIHI